VKHIMTRPSIKLSRHVRRKVERFAEEEHVRLTNDVIAQSYISTLLKYLCYPLTWMLSYVKQLISNIYSLLDHQSILTCILYICLMLILFKIIAYMVLRVCQAYANRCSYGKCKVKELIPVVCPDCRLNYCLRHRHPQDHQCKGYQDTGRKVSNTGYAALQRLNKTSTSNNSRQRNNVASVSNVPQRTLLTSLGKDLDRERRQRQQVNARSMNGMSEDEALQQALKASLEQDNNTSTSQQEESDLELARRLQREEEEARRQRRLRDQQQRNAAESSSDSRCHVS